MNTTERNGISRITIENLKGIGNKISIPLKPITLLVGANSAGKSTVLQAIDIAYHVLNGDGKFFAGGKQIGHLYDLVHSHNLNQRVKIGFDCSWPDDEPTMEEIGQRSECTIELSLGATWLDATVDIFYGGQIFCKVEYSAWDEDTPCNGVFFGVNQHHELCQRLDKLHPTSTIQSYFDETEKRLFVGMYTNARDWRVADEHHCWTGVYLPGSDEVDIEDETHLLFLAKFGIAPIQLLWRQLNKLRHVGPIRSIPESGLDIKQIDDDSWYDGLASWKVALDEVSSSPSLKEMEDFGRESAHFLTSIRRMKWFEYDLTVQGKAEFIIPPDQWASIHKQGEGTEEKRINQVLKGLQKVYDTTWTVNAFEKVLTLRHKKTGIVVEPSAVGTGISQVFPVLAAAMTEGTQLVMIEQPELHIHPRLQCELADFFIAQSHHYQDRAFMIETHSEHLILRFLRRIRETARHELANESFSLSPDEIGVFYFEEADDGVRVLELRIGPNGEFLDEWPGGFFEEAFNETAGGL